MDGCEVTSEPWIGVLRTSEGVYTGTVPVRTWEDSVQTLGPTVEPTRRRPFPVTGRQLSQRGRHFTLTVTLQSPGTTCDKN